MLLADVADQYVDYLENPKTKKSTREQLDWFLAHTGKQIRITALRVHDVTQYLKTKDWAEGTKAAAVNRITSALNWAVAEGLIDDHKVKFARGKKPRYARRETIPSEVDHKKLEDAAYPELKRVLVALRESGARPGEICAVTIDKVNLKNRVITVPNKTAKTTGKQERDVYLSVTLADLIRDAMGSRTEGAVFLNSYGKPWNSKTIGHSVRRLRIKLGLPDNVVAYSLRHSWFSRAINDTDANVALVARQGGHSDLNMLLKTYLHESPEAMRRTVDKISARKKSGG
jgi:integrase